MESPKISIVTPSLNQGKFIEETILSVLSQNYPRLEYLVVDGGSSDTTLHVLERYSDRIRWISERDGGQTNAINKGLRLTDGTIVGYLNADDILLPGSLWTVADAFARHSEVRWVIGKCRIVDEKNSEIRKPITNYKNFLLKRGSFPLLVMTNYISQPATFWRRDALETVGFLDESLHYVMDYEYWLRLYSRYSPLFLPQYLAAFKIHPSSKTTSMGHRNAYVEEERRVVKRYTNSAWLLFLHDLHRLLMTTAYSIINRKGV
ncbi:glycosyltransferase family 2 protein [Anaerolinea sp.]|uniref:glycosyltransferase family 2 protein n=1 Tax=Anaerolinea sp. TaxID=1872519 RepID=UPI002ACE6688|nr:glycosyltransferase family 2 protein [Anaerolinea sp.]